MRDKNGRASFHLIDGVSAFAAGSAVWLTYWAVEIALHNLGPAAIGKLGDATSEHFRLLGVLGAAAFLIGGVSTALAAGGLAALRGRRLERGRLIALGNLTLALALGISLLRSDLAAPAWLALTVVACIAAVTSSAVLGRIAGGTWLHTNPWALSLLLVVPSFLAVSISEGDRHVPAVAVLMLASLGAAVWFFRRFLWSVKRSDVSLVRLCGSVVIVLAAVTGTLGVVGRPESPALPICSAAGTSDQPDVVLIVMDTVRRDHLSAYGYRRSTTPGLVRLARRATTYRSAIAPADMTLPSHASLFSGLYPRWHGAYCSKSAPRGRPIADAPRLLAERLGERGYLTMGLAANHYVSPEFGLAKGFVAFRNTVRIDLTSAATAYTLRPLLRQIVEFFCPLPEFDRTPYSAQELTDLALDLVEDAADCAAPSMLFLNYMDAHIPYVPPPPYDTKFPGLKTDLLSLESFTEIREGFLGGEDELREDQRLHFISQYDGALAYLDANITRLVERLKELDQYHDTLLIVMADHGEAFGEKGLLEHQVGTYESTIGVPLIIKYPSQVEPRVVEAPISIVDVPATIVDAAGVDGGQIHGRSLLAAREGHGQPVFAELLACATTREINPIFERKEQAAVSGDWKLIRSDRSPHQLYHLAEDPTEKTNLQTQRRDKERRLERILKNWAAGFPAPDSESLEIDPELLERLRSLGYL